MFSIKDKNNIIEYMETISYFYNTFILISIDYSHFNFKIRKVKNEKELMHDHKISNDFNFIKKTRTISL